MQDYVQLLRLLLAMATATLINGCSHQKNWEFREVISAQYGSRQLFYHPESCLNGIGLELLQGPFGIVGYAEVTVCTIPPLSRNPSQAQLIVEIQQERISYESLLMEGGQRLLLPQEATDKILDSLRNHLPVTLYLKGYISHLDPADYSKSVAKFLD